MKNEPIQAVHQSDLKQSLEDLEMYDAFAKGEQFCFYCKDVINENNLSAIFPCQGAIVTFQSLPDR